MNKILELEALRGGAALYVFFHHTLFSFGIVQKSSIVGKLFSFGQEAVMIFFLLSGYVIALSINKKHYKFKEYFKHRFFRIYPIVLIAWIVSCVSLVLIGRDININAFDVWVNLGMLQDISALKPGVFANPLFGDDPLWSLSYEWWFYMLFFIHYYLYKKYFDTKLFLFNLSALLISIIGLLTFKIHFNQVSLIVMYYYIWFSGALVLFALQKDKLNKQMLISISISYAILFFSYIFLFIYGKSLGRIGVHPILELRHYLAAFMGILIALGFYKYLYKHFKINRVYRLVINIFSALAPISFGLYVLHYPIKNYFLQFTEVNNYVLLFSSLLITLILSYVAEIKIYGYIRKKI